MSNLNISKIREDFPALNQKIRGKDLVYFDNAATTLKPKVVIDALLDYYTKNTANVHRGVHTLSQNATDLYEDTRFTVQKFLNAKSEKEIIYTSGTTESINLVASSYGQDNIKAGDEIVISYMEHHSGIVPWQLLAERTGAKLKVMPINDKGEIILDDLDSLFNEKTKVVSFLYASNSLGTVNPVKKIIEKVRKNSSAAILIDAAQAVSHFKIDVQELDCDFLAFSAHKLFGPTGFGILYGKEKLLDSMPPYKGGGDMIDKVTFEKTTYNELPLKFEAGTPHIAGSIGTNAAIKYINSYNIEDIYNYENELLSYATDRIKSIQELEIIGQASKKVSVLSFHIPGIHPQDLGMILDQEGIAVRTGHHCTQPIMDKFNLLGTSRASFSFYNTKEEIDIFIAALNKAVDILK